MESARIAKLLAFLKEEPDDIFLQYALGLEYQNDPNLLPLAEQQFRKIIAADENYLAAYYQLGKLHETRGQIAKALEVLKKGLVKARELKKTKSAAEFEEAIFMLED
jgi:tetratricopeptide (TPR) repeat protein